MRSVGWKRRGREVHVRLDEGRGAGGAGCGPAGARDDAWSSEGASENPTGPSGCERDKMGQRCERKEWGTGRGQGRTEVVERKDEGERRRLRRLDFLKQGGGTPAAATIGLDQSAAVEDGRRVLQEVADNDFVAEGRRAAAGTNEDLVQRLDRALDRDAVVQVHRAGRGGANRKHDLGRRGAGRALVPPAGGRQERRPGARPAEANRQRAARRRPDRPERHKGRVDGGRLPLAADEL